MASDWQRVGNEAIGNLVHNCGDVSRDLFELGVILEALNKPELQGVRLARSTD
jgi:hypothetical protein